MADSDRLSLQVPPRGLGTGLPDGAPLRFDFSPEPAQAEPQHGFFDMLAAMLKAILELLLAPLRFLFGLFGVGSSEGQVPQLTAAEQANGRPVSLTRGGLPDTGQFGPYALEKRSLQLPTAAGGSTPADVYLPKGPGPFPVVIHSYGLASSPEHHAGTASHYASWGMVVIVPHLPHGGGSPGDNAPELSGWVAWLQSRPAQLPALDLRRGVGLSGHSFGGLSSLLAAPTPGVGCVVALDPADTFDAGENMAGRIQVPTAFVVGDRSLANQFGNGRDIYQAAGGAKQLVHVQGARHVDFENASVTGAKNPANQAAMREAVGFMLGELTGRPEFAAYLHPGQTEVPRG